MEFYWEWDRVKYISDLEIEIIGNRYDVEFQEDALSLVSKLVSRYYHAIISKRISKPYPNFNKSSLKMIFTELLEIASARLRADIDSNAQVARLRKDEYLLYRNLVEIRGATREKDPRSHSWVLRMKEENEYLCDSLDKFVENWMQKHFLVNIVQMSYITEQMKSVQDLLRSFISQSKLQKEDAKFIQLKVVELLVEFRQSTCKTVHPASVTADKIAQAARQLIGIPSSWVLNSYKPRLQGLRQRLCRRIAGQDHIINAISNVFSSPGSCERVRRPIASFLFLCGACFLQNELYEALCEEIYDSKDHLIKFDMSDYHDVLPSQDSNGILVRRRIVDAVRSNPFCVLLLENVEKANKKTISFLCDISGGGRQTDNEVNEYDFSNTLILMTSEVGKNVFNVCDCNCLDMERPMKESGLKKMDHYCFLLAAFREAKMSFGLDLLDSVDDVMPFNIIDEIDQVIFTRMCLREAIDAIRKECKLIVYSSEAAIQSMMSDHLRMEPGGGAALMKWIEDHIVPKLYTMVSVVKNRGFCTVFIDTLIGTDELSYRLELGNPVDVHILNNSSRFFNRLESEYRGEKKLFSDFYHLKTLTFKLIYLMDRESLVCQLSTLKEMVDRINIIFKYASGAPLCSAEPLNIFRREADRCLKEWGDARGRMRIDGLRTILYSNKAECDATNVIIGSVLGLPDACIEQLPCPTKSFLLLGLTSGGKSDLLESVVQHSITDQKRYSIISIDMEEHGDTGSLIRFIVDSLTHSSSGTHGLPVSNCTTLSSILVIDQVEKARMPVFCGLLSMLDHGILKSEDGKLFDFRKSVVVMMSNMGSKEILARVVGSISRNPCGIDARMLTRQAGSRFRTELLNHVDEILMFDPFTQSQLRKFSSLSLRVGRHLAWDDVHLNIPMALSVLFEEPDPQISFACQKRKLDVAVCHLSRVIVKNWNDAVLLERGAPALTYTNSFA